jgi:hypothetical protein
VKCQRCCLMLPYIVSCQEIFRYVVSFLRLQQSGRHQETPSKGATSILGLTFPFKTRRASQERASQAKCCLSGASCAEPALSEKRRAARRAASYGRFLLVTFLVRTRKVTSCYIISEYCKPNRRYLKSGPSPRIGGTSPGPPPEVEGLDQN